jgi:hypothetical protein
MKLTLVTGLLIFSVMALNGAEGDHRHLELAADGVLRLEIRCGSGMLHVKGIQGLDRIDVDAVVSGRAATSTGDVPGTEQGIRLRLYRERDRAILISDVDVDTIEYADAKIDLAVTVPVKMPLQIDDGSGIIEIQNIAGDVMVSDDSGRLRIADVFGRVTVVDGSGSILIENIRGFVSVQDGSGSITIMQIEGDVNINDGSGWVRIAKIDGNVTISDDSGSIDIQDVTRNVIVRETGSGQVSIERVNGKVISREEP